MTGTAAARTERPPPPGLRPLMRGSSLLLLQLASTRVEATPGAGIPAGVRMKGCKLGAPRPSPPTPAAPGRLGLGQPRGKRGKGSGTGPQLPLSRRRQARWAVQPVHSPLYKTAVVGSRKFPRLHFYSGRRFSPRWAGYGAA